jgi:hypothetical protein
MFVVYVLKSSYPPLWVCRHTSHAINSLLGMLLAALWQHRGWSRLRLDGKHIFPHVPDPTAGVRGSKDNPRNVGVAFSVIAQVCEIGAKHLPGVLLASRLLVGTTWNHFVWSDSRLNPAHRWAVYILSCLSSYALPSRAPYSKVSPCPSPVCFASINLRLYQNCAQYTTNALTNISVQPPYNHLIIFCASLGRRLRPCEVPPI